MNYRLTDNKLEFNGETLFQIECVEDCKWAKKGELGGYIASYENLEDGGWVGIGACVCDTSVVSGCIETGFVVGNCVVEGKVRGFVAGDSYIDNNTELDDAYIKSSYIYNSKYKAIRKGDLELTYIEIASSCVSDCNFDGIVFLSECKIQKSEIGWQSLEGWDLEEGYEIGYCEAENFEETGEVITKRVGDKPIVKENEEIKTVWTKFADMFDINNLELAIDIIKDYYEDKGEWIRNIFKTKEEAIAYLDSITNLEDYYYRLFSEEEVEGAKLFARYIKENPDKAKSKKIREMKRLGYTYC